MLYDYFADISGKAVAWRVSNSAPLLKAVADVCVVGGSATCGGREVRVAKWYVNKGSDRTYAIGFSELGEGSSNRRTARWSPCLREKHDGHGRPAQDEGDGEDKHVKGV